MPGIVGIITKAPADQRELELQVEHMLTVMQHEPTYVSGKYELPQMGIYAGWVAHQGSLSSNQIFRSEQNDVALVFAGECFFNAETHSLLRQIGYDGNPSAGDWLIRPFEMQYGLRCALLARTKAGGNPP